MNTTLQHDVNPYGRTPRQFTINEVENRAELFGFIREADFKEALRLIVEAWNKRPSN